MANNNEMSITYDYKDKEAKSSSANITDIVSCVSGIAPDTLNAVTSGIAVIQQMGEWITVAQTALDKYNAALVTTGTASTSGAAASTQLMNVLTPLQMVYGALTHQITMTEAAQQLLNSAIFKNPYAAAATAITGLLSALYIYAETHKSTSEEMRNSLNDLMMSHQDAMRTIEEKSKLEISEAEKVNLLKSELYELEMQIKSGNLTDNEAIEAKRKFSYIASELETIIPGICDAIYDENGAISLQTDRINELTGAYYKLAIAKSMSNIYQEKFEQINKDIVDAKKIQKQAYDEYDLKKSIYDNTEKNKQKVGHGGIMREVSTRSAMDAVTGYQNATATVRQANQTVMQLGKEREEIFKEWQQQEQIISELTQNYFSTTGESSDAFSRKIATANSANTASTRAALSQQRDAYAETFEALVEQLQYNRDTGEITEREYYETLESYRDKYLTNGSREWQRYTKEIYNYEQQLLEEQKRQLEDKRTEAKNLYNEITDYALDKIGEVEKKQEEYSKKLSSYGSLFNKNTIEFDGETIEYYSLGDIDKDIEAINAYSDKMLEFKNRSAEFGISDKAVSSYLAEINNMSVDEGTMALNALLSADDDKLKEYMLAYDKLLTASDEAAGDYYAPEMEAATEDAYKNMIGKLEEAGYVVPEGWKEIGIKSADSYGQAFVDEIDKWLANVNANIDAAMQRVTQLQAMSASERESSGQTIYADNRQTNTTVYVQSAHQSAEAVKANTKYQTHTQPWG